MSRKYRHHIVPYHHLKHKDKKFINDKRNLIDVTLEQHASLHKWLFMLTGSRGDESAWIGLSTGKFYYDNTGKTFGYEFRKKVSKALKGNTNYKGFIGKGREKMSQPGPKNPMYGKTHSKEVREMIQLSQLGSKNSQFGTCWIYSLDKKKSIKIHKDDLQEYVDKGWIKGRKLVWPSSQVA